MQTQGMCLKKFSVILGLIGFITACSSNGGNSTASTNPASSVPQSQLAKAMALYDQATTICTPMNGSTPPPPVSITTGVQGELYALQPPQFGEYTHVADYINNGTDTGVTVFLNSINVPTRDFYEGFPAANGQLLSFNNQVLLEWFALDLHSDLQLQATDTAGDYQFALLSDDGAIFSLQLPGSQGFTTIVNDDGTHPTTMACATSPVTFTQGQPIPMHLQYYQGPRYQIALQLMWRPWPSKQSSVNDPLCGASGNYEFFDPDVEPSTPQQNYLALLARGWLPVPAGNFVIPYEGINPCSVPDFNSAQ